jgi:hypothetical protein
MNSYICVEPCDLIQIISKIKINVLHLELNTSATIQCMCYDFENKFLNSYIFTLEGDEYQMWGQDNYLIELICEKYGFVLREPTVPL